MKELNDTKETNEIDSPDDKLDGILEELLSDLDLKEALDHIDEKNIRYDNCSYNQGETEKFPDMKGTCGPTSIANALNLITESYDYSEESVLEAAVDKKLCDIESADPDQRGGTTTREVCEIIHEVTESDDTISLEVFEDDTMISPEEFYEKLENPDTVAIVAVDADRLWGSKEGFAIDSTDHWITVVDGHYNEDGNLDGLHIVDSGGHMDYADLETFEKAAFGGFENVILDKSVILLTKNSENTENTFLLNNLGGESDEDLI